MRVVSGGTRASCEKFVGARPVERALGLEDLGVRVRLRALAGGGSRIVHSRPAADDQFGNRMQCVGEGGVSVVHVRNCEGMVLADDIVRGLLALGHQVAVGEVVAGQTVVAGDPGAFDNLERETRKPALWTSLGAKPVAALTELLHESST